MSKFFDFAGSHPILTFFMFVIVCGTAASIVGSVMGFNPN